MFVKSSKQNLSCANANDGFDDKSNKPTSTAFYMKKNWTNFFKNGHCVAPAPVSKINVAY